MKTIYFCHDQQHTVDTRKNDLETAGYQVVVFETGGDLMRAIARDEPDLVLLDALLVGKTGFEVAEGLDLVDRPRFPVILFSGIYTRRIFEEEAERVGVARYLPTNLDRDDLLAVMTQVLSGERGQSQAA